MTIPKYARTEHESRFSVTTLADLALGDYSHIEDRYIGGTRLRLRCVTFRNGAAPVLKLCKKYGAVADAAEPVVNICLGPDEYTLFSILSALTVVKRHHHILDQRNRFASDVFEAALTGLVIAELETDDTAASHAVTMPSWAAREITDDPWFRGGNLATVSGEMLAARLEARSKS